MSLESAGIQSLSSGRHAHVAEAFEILAHGLGPFVDSGMGKYFAEELSWEETAANRMGRANEHGASDPLFQLLVLRRFWGPVFADFFGEDLRPLIGQLVEARNLWAHLSLPDDPAYLDRVLLTIERLLAPVDPDHLSDLRRLRSSVKDQAAPSGEAARLSQEERVTAQQLEAQLAESEGAFQDLQDSFGSLTKQLELARRAAAGKQLRISTIEQQLHELNGRSKDLDETLTIERDTRDRIEWLFVSFIAVMLIVMVLLAGYR